MMYQVRKAVGQGVSGVDLLLVYPQAGACPGVRHVGTCQLPVVGQGYCKGQVAGTAAGIVARSAALYHCQCSC